ncbi:hypothetical protein QZH41_007805 [Actinostola sp. cb2023]|nr:hypothetical protein QZH41_007805 [Actinostola sp. cb2023]
MTPCQFYIPQSSDFIDMGMCELVLGVKIVKADGSDMDHTLNIGMVNNVGHSLIKRFDVKLNDTSVGEPTDLYHYKAYDSNLRNFSQDQKDNYLQIEGWYTDESTDAKMNNFTTGTVNTPILATAAAYNKGFDERTRLFYSHYTGDGTDAGVGTQASREVHFTIQPAVDVFQSGRYLVPGVSIVIQIDFNDPQFVLMAAAGSTARFQITRAVFRVRHVKVQAEAHLEVEDKQYKQQKTVVYPIRTSKPIRRTIEAGKSFVSFTDLFQQSVPDYLTIGFVKSTSFNGAYNENPYNFKLFGLKDFRMVVNGVERPKSRFEFKSHDAVEGYEMMFSSTGNMHRGFSNVDYCKEYGQEDLKRSNIGTDAEKFGGRNLNSSSAFQYARRLDKAFGGKLRNAKCYDFDITDGQENTANQGFVGNSKFLLHSYNLYKIQDQNQTLHLLATRKMRTCDEGWQEFDVIDAGRKWYENSTNNYGLAMTVVSPSNHPQSPADFGFVVDRRGPNSKHPLYAAIYKKKDQRPVCPITLAIFSNLKAAPKVILHAVVSTNVVATSKPSRHDRKECNHINNLDLITMERIKPPPELDIESPNLADSWKEWKESWQLYKISSGLSEKEDDIKVATLQSVLGIRSRRVLKTLPAIYVFNRMNDEEVKIEKNKLLKKEFDDNSIAEVLISKEQPMVMKYSKNNEMLAISFNYGYWNSFGIPQH